MLRSYLNPDDTTKGLTIGALGTAFGIAVGLVAILAIADWVLVAYAVDVNVEPFGEGLTRT